LNLPLQTKEFTDLKPSKGINRYRLIYDFRTNIKMELNTVEMEIENNRFNWFVFENPNTTSSHFNLFAPDISKNLIRLSDINGKTIDLIEIKTQEDYFEVRTKLPLAAGFYVVYAQNSEGIPCSVRFIQR
jgi:hypothetical protein